MGLLSEGALQEVDQLMHLPIHYREEVEQKRQANEAQEAATQAADVPTPDDGF